MDLAAGRDLHALVAMGREIGVTEQNPLTQFFTFSLNFAKERHEVGPQDRFDLMCGCKVLFPGTLGAAQ